MSSRFSGLLPHVSPSWILAAQPFIYFASEEMGMQRGAVACPPSWKPRVKPTLSHRITTEGWGLEPSESPPTAGPPPPRLQVRVWDCTWTSSTGRADSGCRCATEEMRAPGLRFVTSISFNLLHVQWWSVSCCLRDCQPWHLCLSAERLVVSQNRCGLVETGAATTVFCFCFFFKEVALTLAAFTHFPNVTQSPSRAICQRCL